MSRTHRAATEKVAQDLDSFDQYATLSADLVKPLILARKETEAKGYPMQQQVLFPALQRYERTWLEPRMDAMTKGWSIDPERQSLERMRSFMQAQPEAYSRHCPIGHMTGSALVATPSLDRVLLHLHRKLGIWIQLGGHADGEQDMAAVALREAREESGLEDFSFFVAGDSELSNSEQHKDSASATPFDVDIHLIPERAGVPAHLHYDVRYLLIAEQSPEAIVKSHESLDLRWFSVQEALELCSETSMQRQLNKLAFLAAETRLPHTQARPPQQANAPLRT